MLNRRQLLKALAAGSIAVGTSKFAESGPPHELSSRRPPPSQRKFTSRSVEEIIQRVKAGIGDPEIAWMFENCYPNTLDTTVHIDVVDGKPDTFIITGDIDAMWLRDSSCQVWPYLPLAKDDGNLRRMFCGLIG